MQSYLYGISSGERYPLEENLYTCPRDGGLLDVVHDLSPWQGKAAALQQLFDQRMTSWEALDRSGVWRYRELIAPSTAPKAVVTRGEGNTTLYKAPPALASYANLDALQLKHEGENPTGSFKDRGMTTGVTRAREIGAKAVICASTGNTSASMASFAALAGLKPLILFPYGKVAVGKVAQSLAYGALNIQVRGDFDAALQLVRRAAAELPVYLLNSVNPFRLEGQKSIIIELLHQRGWRVPDWIVVPGGNLGNSAAFGKALRELREVGLIDRLPRIAVIQAAGAAPFAKAFQREFEQFQPEQAETIATAIRIGNPASYPKARQTILQSEGWVAAVSDQDILDAKAQIDAAGIGCEPASAATVAGIRTLRAQGIMHADEDIVCILTGHILKDPQVIMDYHDNSLSGLRAQYPNPMHVIDGTLDELQQFIDA